MAIAFERFMGNNRSLIGYEDKKLYDLPDEQ
jgi:hypothetical protein